MKKIFNKFKDVRVLVVGDVMLDEYIWGNVTRISPEAPVPIVEVSKTTQTLGGAGNVINNIASFGAKPIICGLVGADSVAGILMTKMSDLGLDIRGLIVDPTRPTTIKRRVMGNDSQIVRLDVENTDKINGDSVKRVLNFLKSSIDDVDIVIISDYNKGVITKEMVVEIVRIAKEKNIKVISDPQKNNFNCHKYVDLITPNLEEASYYCGFKIKDKRTLARAGRKLIVDLKIGSVIITCGEDGMSIFRNSAEVIHVSSTAKKVFDVSGAGDTVISVLALGLVVGLELEDAAKLANIAAGIVVGKRGTSTVSVEELNGT